MVSELQRGEIFAGYRIEGVAGRGGMGIVYRARAIDGDHAVALKLMAPAGAGDDRNRQRFDRESRLLASIEHPNVIAPLDVGEAGDQPYIAMPFVDGLDLAKLIAREGGLEPPRAARIVAGIAMALDAAHARGLVHRDVKPSNVLVEADDGDERALLTDFGLSRLVKGGASTITREGRWVGSVDYAAPEQIEDAPIDARADVYALGCVLFHCLTGAVPFPRSSDPAKLWAHVHEAPPSPVALRPGLAGEWDPVVARALAKRAEERHPSAGELGSDALRAAIDDGPELDAELERLAAGRPDPGATVVSAERPVALRSRGRWRRARLALATRERRRRWLALGAALAGLGVVPGLAIVLATGGGEPRPAGSSPATVPELAVARFGIGDRAEPGNLAADATGVSVLDRRAGDLVRLDDLGRILGRTPIGPSPTGVAIDGANERAYALSFDRDLLRLIDLPSGRAIATTPTQAEPGYVVPSGDGAVVLGSAERDASLLRIGPEGQRVGGPVEIGGSATDLEPTLSGVAVLGAFPPVVSLYSRGDLRRPRDQFLVEQEGLPADMAIDGNTAWIAFFDPARVVRLDLRTGRTIGRPIEVGREPSQLVVADGVVYVPSARDGTIIRIDAETAEPLGAPTRIEGLGGSAAASGDTVWLAGRDGVIRVRPE